MNSNEILFYKHHITNLNLLKLSIIKLNPCSSIDTNQSYKNETCVKENSRANFIGDFFNIL